jgi:hypothetical protein
MAFSLDPLLDSGSVSLRETLLDPALENPEMSGALGRLELTDQGKRRLRVGAVRARRRLTRCAGSLRPSSLTPAMNAVEQEGVGFSRSQPGRSLHRIPEPIQPGG